MNKTSHLKLHSLPVILIAATVLAVMGLFVSTGSYRWLTVAFAAGILLLLARRDLSVLRHPAALLLLVYVLVAGVSIFWAMSGKFFLREYTKIFLAACLFVAVLLTKQFERSTVRTLFSLLCTVSAVYSVLSVEYVSTGFPRHYCRC